MTNFDELAAELVRDIKDGFCVESDLVQELRVIAQQARDRALEEADLICDQYADEMERAAKERAGQDKPSLVADSKADAGNSLGRKVRALKSTANTGESK